ncbi:MAG: WD40 repeat domain-containing protein [Armatimonadota bacterium]
MPRLSTLWFAALVALAWAAAPSRADGVDFAREVAPIFARSCVACHGERIALGGWRAHTAKALLASGASGKPLIVPGKPERSGLLARLRSKDPVARMPQGDDPLPAAQVAVVERWIREGARVGGVDPTAPLAGLGGPIAHPSAPKTYPAPVPVLAVALSPDARLVATGGYHEVVLWNVADGGLVRRIDRLPQRIQSIRWSRDGRSLLVAGGSPGSYGEASVVAIDGVKRSVLSLFPDIALAAAWSPDERTVVAGGADASVRAVDVATGKERWRHKVHADWVTGIGFTGDGKYVASSGRDKVVKVYEAASGTLFTTYGGHNRNIGRYRGQSPVWAVAFPEGSPQVLSVGGGAWVQVWEPEKAMLETGDAGDMEERFQTRSHARHLAHGLSGSVFAMATAGGRVFVAGEDGKVALVDPTGAPAPKRVDVGADWIYALGTDPAGRVLAAGGYDGTVTLIDPSTGTAMRRFVAAPGWKPAGR